MSGTYSYPDANRPQPLHNGDAMTQAEFHRSYLKMPEKFKAELIGGTVFVCQPLSLVHADAHPLLSALLVHYAGNTPGLSVGDNATIIFGEEDEMQPDLHMRILPEFHGQTSYDDKGKYVTGPPEFVAEVAYSTRAIDLHLKRRRYQRNGVLEYVVLCLAPSEIFWFDFRQDRLIECDEENILKSEIFPGLWISKDGLLQQDYNKVMFVLQRGLASTEHGQYVASMKRRETR